MTNPVFGIRLNDRQAWVWQRLGNHYIREWLAPQGLCLECRSLPSQPTTRNAWFCYACQDSLDQLSLLPEAAYQVLEDQNRDLRAEIEKLRTLLNESPDCPEAISTQQLSLF
jgi:hypothetical protein